MNPAGAPHESGSETFQDRLMLQNHPPLQSESSLIRFPVYSCKNERLVSPLASWAGLTNIEDSCATSGPLSSCRSQLSWILVLLRICDWSVDEKMVGNSLVFH